MDVDNLTVFITGGGSGLGVGAAKIFHAAGAKVAVADINSEGAKLTAEAVGGIAVDCDVTSPASVEAAIRVVTAELGVPRVCINCAGIAVGERIVGREGPMLLDSFSKVININLIGSFNVMRVAAAAMIAAEPLDDVGERGLIINTASVAAFDGQIGQSAYSASKGGIVALTLPAAREFSQFGVRVMTIAPGIMGTPMLGSMPQEVQDSLARMVPFPKRLGTPAEYGKLALHLAENQLMNGEVIRLDGAIRMAPK